MGTVKITVGVNWSLQGTCPSILSLICLSASSGCRKDHVELLLSVPKRTQLSLCAQMGGEHLFIYLLYKCTFVIW